MTSLASKYLHFHKTDCFYLYDERARKTVNFFAKGRIRSNVDSCCNEDRNYMNFYVRVRKIEAFLYESSGDRLSPRDLDDLFLLSYKYLTKNKIF